MSEVCGWIFNIQRFCCDDGPGIRTTVFLKGCPLRCVWCHNAESQLPRPQFAYDPSRCLRCEACLQACPQHALSFDEPFPRIDVCTGCGKCVDACPTGARQLIGRHISVSGIVDEIRRDEHFYDASFGGVTFSGGEPLTQLRFLTASLKACHEAGIHTCLDTCGYAHTEEFLEVAGLADLILYDVKHMDPARHSELTGVSNELILENLRRLSRTKTDVWIRVPLIPGCNDDDDNLNALGEFLQKLRRPYPIWLLPYHELGQQKHTRLGSKSSASELKPPTPAHVANCADLLRDYGLDVRIR